MNDLSDAFTGGDALSIVISKVSALNDEIQKAKQDVIAKASKKDKKKIEAMKIGKPIIVNKKTDSFEDMQNTKINWYALAIALVGPEKVTGKDEKGNDITSPLSADDCFHLLGVERKNNMSETEEMEPEI